MTEYDETNARGSYPRLAIVTGADSGIGRATALLLATEGFDIGLTVHRDVAGAEATASEVTSRGQRCVQATFDASAPDASSSPQAARTRTRQHARRCIMTDLRR